jgi:integrase
LARAVAAVNAAHRAAGQHAPGDDPGVAATLRGIRATRRQPRRRAKPVSLAALRTVLAAIDRTSWPAGVIGTRDTAILLLGFAGALRRSELAAITTGDVELADGALTLRIRSSKTDQEGQGQSVGYPRGTRRDTCAACAVLNWAAVLAANAAAGRVGVLRLLHDTRPACTDWTGLAGHSCTNPDQVRTWAELAEADGEAPLLRPVTKAATIAPRPVSGATVDEVLRRRLRGAGIDPAGYSAHSLRAGFITVALVAGANHHEVMRQTRHASPATVEVYARHYTPLEANAVTRIGL